MADSQRVVLYEGPSQFDEQPIVVIATGIRNASQNAKTGPMIQTYILRQDLHPAQAAKSGKDAAVCGDCRLRPVHGGSCYVDLILDGVSSLWKTYRAGRFEYVNRSMYKDRSVFAGRMIRFGAYGDPAAAPFTVWSKLAKAAWMHTGYTHAWRTCNTRFRQLLMASVDNPDELAEAQARGWRTFRTLLADADGGPAEPLVRREFICPASPTGEATLGRKVTCAQCGACNGGEKRSSVAIPVHGYAHKVTKYTAMRVKGEPVLV